MYNIYMNFPDGTISSKFIEVHFNGDIPPEVLTTWEGAKISGPNCVRINEKVSVSQQQGIVQIASVGKAIRHFVGELAGETTYNVERRLDICRGKIQRVVVSGNSGPMNLVPNMDGILYAQEHELVPGDIVVAEKLGNGEWLVVSAESSGGSHGEMPMREYADGHLVRFKQITRDAQGKTALLKGIEKSFYQNGRGSFVDEVMLGCCKLVGHTELSNTKEKPRKRNR